MPKKYHLNPRPAPPRFVLPGPYGIIEGDGCLNCANCVKKSCVYSVYLKRRYDDRQMFDTADSLCKNCFRCVQGCYGRVLSKSINPEFWSMGDDYWTREIIASNQGQAETGKIPVSGGGYGGPFCGPGFDSMWTDMSEIVRPTRDGIHGREYISTSVDLGRIPKKKAYHQTPPSEESPFPRVEASVPILFDSLSFGELRRLVLPAVALAAREANTFMILRAEEIRDELFSLISHLIPLLPPGSLGRFQPLISQARMVQLPFEEGIMKRVREVKEINPQTVVSIRLPLTPQAEVQVEELEVSGAEVLHLLADEKGREQNSRYPRFIKDSIRAIHLHLVRLGRRDGPSLVFGGGIAMAEHVAKAVICGADAVTIDCPLLIALECRLCGRCTRGMSCPVELEKSDRDWGRQRVLNLMAAWHGQLLEVLGAMGLRDVRRLRGEAGRAIFLEDIEKETFGQIFGEPVKKLTMGEESIHALAS